MAFSTAFSTLHELLHHFLLLSSTSKYFLKIIPESPRRFHSTTNWSDLSNCRRNDAAVDAATADANANADIADVIDNDDYDVED